MTGSPGTGPATRSAVPRTIPAALFIGVLVVTVIAASVASIVLFRWLTTPETPEGTLAVAGPNPAGAAQPARLIVDRPDRRFGAGPGGYVEPGSRVAISLPEMPAETSAVLLQVSMHDAAGPGLVTVRSAAETAPVLRLPAAGGQTSATVVAVLGPDRRLELSTEGGGTLSVDLLGRFERAATSSAGRIVPVAPVTALDLLPERDGHDATVDLGRIPGLPSIDDGQVSAVILRVAGQVGRGGGYMVTGPAADQLDQLVYWGGTQPGDEIRNGFLVVPVQSPVLHVRYHAGHELRLELAGFVTGPGAETGTAGLAVPVPFGESPAVQVTAGGSEPVSVVGPDGGNVQGAPGLTANRVHAVITILTATGTTPGPVSVTAPGGAAPALPDLSAGPKPRAALALSPVRDGRVDVTSAAGARITLTPRLFVLA